MASDLLVVSEDTGRQIDEAISLDSEIDPSIQLGLTLQDYTEFPLRDLAVYLEQIDRFFGRLSTGSLRSYSQKKEGLRFETAYQTESWELLVDVANTIENGKYILLLGWLLARLPNIIEAIPNAVKTFEEARLLRERRNQIEARGAEKNRERTGEASSVEDTLAQSDYEAVSQSLSEIEVYNNLDDQATTEINASLLGTLIKELVVNKRKLKSAAGYNVVHLEEVELTVRPGTFDPQSDDPRLRQPTLLQVQIPVVEEQNGDE